MSGHREADERTGVNGSGSLERDLIAEILREEPDLAGAVAVVPAALDPVDLPTGAWARLTAALVELGPNAHSPKATGSVSAPVAEPLTGYTPLQAASQGGSPRPGWNWTHPFTWLSAAAVAAVIIGLGTWGALQSGERTRLADEQRVLAYWMANPDLRMVSLQEIGSSAEAGGEGASGRLGVVCILPDGRALLLQPAAAGRGQSYVVVGHQGDADADQTVLGSGTGNVIRFDLAGAERIVVMLASGDGARVPIAWAAVN